jgi:hypothetical protein
VTKISNLLSDSEILSDLEAGINNITSLMSGISNKIASMAGVKWVESFLSRWGVTIRAIILIAIIGIIIAGIFLDFFFMEGQGTPKGWSRR